MVFCVIGVSKRGVVTCACLGLLDITLEREGRERSLF